MRPFAERMDEKIIPEPNTGCWLWMGFCTTGGYGQVRRGPASAGLVDTHRAAWERIHGNIPAGMFVCHKCDVRACCNPDHLFLGTVQDNMDDMWRKGRARPAKGSATGHAILTESDVLSIRRQRGIVLARDLAATYGVKEAAISHVWTRHTWKHLPPEKGSVTP